MCVYYTHYLYIFVLGLIGIASYRPESSFSDGHEIWWFYCTKLTKRRVFALSKRYVPDPRQPLWNRKRWVVGSGATRHVEVSRLRDRRSVEVAGAADVRDMAADIAFLEVQSRD